MPEKRGGVRMTWPDATNLDKLETKRADKKGRLTFDCFRARCRGDRVICSEGKSLSVAKDSSMPLISVLSGRTASVCWKCECFDDGE